MARQVARSTRQTPLPGHREKEDIVAIDNFNEGLFTDADASRIPPNALAIATNVHYSSGMPHRRNGLTIHGITKPDSNRVIRLFGFYHNNTGINIIRFSRNKIYRAGSSGWTEYTPTAIAAMSGDDYDPIFVTTGDNRCFFANNGVDAIREIRPATLDYVALGNAPKYKYVTTGFNRVIGASKVDVTDIPFEIGWSGDRNYGVWDSVTDTSAGSTPLVDSPSDTNDDITGLFTLANVLVVPRTRSCWLGIGQPSATKPFNFYAAVPDAGADIPRTIKLTNEGLIFVNYLESAVYVWRPSGDKQQDVKNISSPKVSRALKRDITDPNYVWASYSKGSRRYSIFIASPSNSTVIEWTYDFESRVWSKSEFGNDVTTVDDIDFASSSVTIDELTGTIDNLVGTIESLAGLSAVSTRFFGFNAGEIKYQGNFFADPADASKIVATDNGTAYTTTIGFQIIESPIEYIMENLVRADIKPFSTGTVTLSYSKNDGLTWTSAKSVTYVSDDLNKINQLQLKKSIRTKRIQWKLTTSDCMCGVIGFYIKDAKGGISK